MLILQLLKAALELLKLLILSKAFLLFLIALFLGEELNYLVKFKEHYRAGGNDHRANYTRRVLQYFYKHTEGVALCGNLADDVIGAVLLRGVDHLNGAFGALALVAG